MSPKGYKSERRKADRKRDVERRSARRVRNLAGQRENDSLYKLVSRR